jgi:CBS-domain-containing membrane protein
MVGEIAGTWLLLLPAMWVSGLAFMLGRTTSVVAGQAEDQASSMAHRSHHFSDPLSRDQVKDLLASSQSWPIIRPEQTVESIRIALLGADHDSLPVVDHAGGFLGVIDRSDIAHLPVDPQLENLLVAVELANGAGVTLHPDEPLDQALRRLHAKRLHDMAVVDGEGRFKGMVSLAQLASHYRNAVEGIESERQTEHSLDAELAARRRGSTDEHSERAHTLAD